MAADARLVIMDEPTSSLTRHEVDALIRLVADLKKSGICIVFVSHRLDEVMEIAERVTVLRDGAKVGEFPAREMNDKKLATLMTGKAYAYETYASNFDASRTVLSVDRLTRLGQFEDVSLEIRAGEIVGLTGLLGSGRTEFALSLFGMNPPTSGEIRLDGKPLALKTNAQAIEEGIAYVSEDRLTLGLVLEQPISSNILVDRARQADQRLGPGAGGGAPAHRAELDRRSRDQGAERRERRQDAFGRQPAARRARQMDGDAAEAARSSTARPSASTSRRRTASTKSSNRSRRRASRSC